MQESFFLYRIKTRLPERKYGGIDRRLAQKRLHQRRKGLRVKLLFGPRINSTISTSVPICRAMHLNVRCTEQAKSVPSPMGIPISAWADNLTHSTAFQVLRRVMTVNLTRIGGSNLPHENSMFEELPVICRSLSER